VPADAQRDLDAVAARLAQAHPETNTDRGVRLLALRDFYLDTTAGLLRVLLAAVLLFLLLACANVVSLQLVRGTAREREIALRVAVGADRRRLVQQLLTEGMLLAVLGTAAGLLVAMWGVDALTPLMPEGVLPRYVDVSLNGRVLAFSAGLALLSGLVFGLVPAWRGTRPDLASSLRAGARSSVGGIGSGARLGLQEALVVGEVAIALVLLVGAGLMVRSLQNQLAVRPGFDAAGVLTARLALPTQRYDAAQRVQFVEALEARLRALPGVEGAAVASALPLSGDGSAAMLTVEGRGDDAVRFYRHRVSPGYFATLDIPIVRGRTLGLEDRREAPAVVVVSQAMAARFWPGQDPIGRRLFLGAAGGPAVTVVGVAGDVRHRDLTGNLRAPTSEPDVYFPYAQSTSGSLELAVRTAGDPTALAGALRREVAALDAGLPVFRVQPLATALRRQTATGRFASVLLSVFSGVALLLAAVGLYGILAFLVALSRRDIAIRMALGASSSRVMAATVRRGLGLVAAGLVLGGATAALTTDVLAAQLFGVSATDPATFGGVALMLLLVALAASWVPASRATRVDPQLALRGE
jgi:predicted permease